MHLYIGHEVAKYGGPEVAHVEGLGYVGGAELHEHSQPLRLEQGVPSPVVVNLPSHGRAEDLGHEFGRVQTETDPLTARRY